MFGRIGGLSCEGRIHNGRTIRASGTWVRRSESRWVCREGAHRKGCTALAHPHLDGTDDMTNQDTAVVAAALVADLDGAPNLRRSA